MTSLRNNAPRRYLPDAAGQRVLIGLTVEETFEFERLEGRAEFGQAKGQALDDGVLWAARVQERWLELYQKHESAWKAWMARSRAEQPRSFKVY
ncbi:hypothetical protein [Bradyrhizobium sp. RT5a]|uniref:hypothetical protein n=1 Tax=Bradyrhizobium sp. RT5a TaxID=3156380 RepID=UPI003392CBB6